MNLFTELSNMLPDGVDLSLTIRKKGAEVTVSLMPKSKKVDDPAQFKIQPLIITGTPEELDNEFVAAIKSPLSQSTGLLANMAEHEKSVKEAAANSKAEKDKKDKEKKEAEARQKKEKKLFEKADEQENEEDYRGAVKTLTAVLEVTSDTQKIQTRITELKEKLNQNSLFGGE
jgi:PRTRC genetic system protein E